MPRSKKLGDILRKEVQDHNKELELAYKAYFSEVVIPALELEAHKGETAFVVELPVAYSISASFKRYVESNKITVSPSILMMRLLKGTVKYLMLI